MHLRDMWALLINGIVPEQGLLFWKNTKKKCYSASVLLVFSIIMDEWYMLGDIDYFSPQTFVTEIIYAFSGLSAVLLNIS